MVTVI